MLHPTVLGTVAQISPGLRRLKPHRVLAAGYNIRLAGELWHPEAVRDIGRLKFEKCRLAPTVVTRRHVQFVGSDEAQLGIAYLPPPLMPDDGRMYGARRGPPILYVGDGARRDQDQYDDDECRQDCPGRFDLIAAVNLRRLTRFISWAMT